MGLNPDYGLNVIGINQRGNFEMRNPWGSLEEKAKTVSTREGTFEFGPTDAKECISHLMIAHIERGNFTSTIQAKHRLGYYCSFDFKVYS